jgi:hypothetical protein
MKSRLVLAFIVLVAEIAWSAELPLVATNSMLDSGNPKLDPNDPARHGADGIPDEIRPHARDYVPRYRTRNSNIEFEMRTFAEFKIAGQQPVGKATLEFNVARYNSPHVVDQEIHVAAYAGDGTITLDDWSRPVTEAGKTPPIPGYDYDESNWGKGVPVSLDVTRVFNKHVLEGSYLGFSFRKVVASDIDPSDRLGYSSLNTVGGFRLRIEHRAASHSIIPGKTPPGRGNTIQ